MIKDLVFVISTKSDIGKTTFIEKLVKFLVARGVNVGTVKDIHIEGFCIDQEGKDTWRHAKAGASMVCARGLHETDILVQEKMELDEIIPFLDVDLVIVEGFKEKIGKKILVAKNPEDYEALKSTLSNEDEVLGVAGPVLEGKDLDDGWMLLKTDEDLDALVEKLQPAIKRNKLSRNRLKMPLEGLGCKTFLDGEEIVMKEYVSQTLKNIFLGAVSELTWNIHDPVSLVEITLTRSKKETALTGNLEVVINQKILKLKPFVQDSLARVLLGYLAALNLPREHALEEASEIRVRIQ